VRQGRLALAAEIFDVDGTNILDPPNEIRRRLTVFTNT
jgi:hypothetical protein